MPRVKTSTARTDRYRRGILVKDEKTKSGWRRDKSHPDDNDTLFCKKGEKYFWWKFRFGGMHVSLTYPRRSQLTQSEFLSQMYDLIDTDVSGISYDGIEDQIEAIKANLDTLMDECQSSLDNIPESLQYAPTGELLQTRIDSLEESINNLDNLDPDGWETELEEMKDDLDGKVNDLESERDTAEEELDGESRDEVLDDYDTQIQTAKDEYEADVEEFKDEKVEETKECIEECE